MAKHSASAHGQEAPQPPSHARRQRKAVLIKKDAKKPVRKKLPKTATLIGAEPLKENFSTNGDLEARIRERAYALHRRQGGHHGQDLEDWLTAEREILSEEACS